MYRTELTINSRSASGSMLAALALLTEYRFVPEKGISHV